MLPNDPDSIGVAEAAAHEAEAKGIHVVVIPTRAQVQGIAALAVHEPGRPLDSDVVHMTAAARGARHGAVTVAAKDAMTTAGPCSVGDALGVVNGDFAIVGKDLYEVACGVLERLIGGGGELVTLVAGAEAGDLRAGVRGVGRAGAPRRRRGGLRGRPGPLPAAGGGGVAVAGVQVRWESPVAADRRQGGRARSRRRPGSRRWATCSVSSRAATCARAASASSTTSTRATCSRWSARS